MSKEKSWQFIDIRIERMRYTKSIQLLSHSFYIVFNTSMNTTDIYNNKPILVHTIVN